MARRLSKKAVLASMTEKFVPLEGDLWMANRQGGQYSCDRCEGLHPIGDLVGGRVRPLCKKCAADITAEMRGERNPPRGALADHAAARELFVSSDSWSALYPKRKAIQLNLLRKYRSGKYDSKKAPKLYAYLMDDAARRYGREFGNGEADGLRMFSPATRLAAGALMAAHDYEEMKLGNFDYLLGARNPPGELPPAVDGCSRCGAIPGQRRFDGSISGRLVAGLCGDCRAELGEKRTGQAGLFQNPRRRQAKKNPPLWSWDGHGINYDGRRVFTMNPDLRGRKGFSYIATHVERALNYLNYPLDVSGNGA